MRLKTVFAVAGVALACGSARAAAYDAVADFGNPVFSYLWTAPASLPANLTLVNDLDFTSESVYFNGLSIPNASVISKNNNATTATISTIVQPPGLLRFDPELNSVTLRFTAPSSDTWNVSGLWQVIDVAPHSHLVSIAVNGATVESSPIGSSFGQQIPFDLGGVPLLAGQTVDFNVASVGGDFSFLSTGFDATISTVPEPASMMLLAGPILLMRRRRR